MSSGFAWNWQFPDTQRPALLRSSPAVRTGMLRSTSAVRTALLRSRTAPDIGLGVMKVLAYFLRLLWWLGAASLPLLINRYYHSFRQAIQCPASGDCYTPGSEHLLAIELLIAFSAFTVWPLFIWHVLVQPWRARVVARRSKAAALVSEPRR